jgi:hypothetical protein
MKSFSHHWFLLAVAATTFVWTPRALATAELTLSDGNGNTATVLATPCGGTCQDATFYGFLGNWSLNVTTGTAAPGQNPILDLSSIDIRNAAAAGKTLTIEWSDDAFTSLSPNFVLSIGGVLGSQGTVTAGLYGGTTDTEFDLSHQIGTTLSFVDPPGNFAGSENVLLGALSANRYALTEVATITFGAGSGEGSFSLTVNAVNAIPEPSSVFLLGSVALIALGGTIRRRLGRVSSVRSRVSIYG